MPRRPRFVLPGVPHHITQRGNNRQDVFFCDQDRVLYLQMLQHHALRHQTRVLAWCLMTNHVHLILIPETPESLALTLGQAHSQYSLEQNRRQRRVGHLWQNRFFSCALEPSHLLAAMHYVELNPVRAGMSGEALGLAVVQCARPYLAGGVRRTPGLALDGLDGGSAAGRLESRRLEGGAWLDDAEGRGGEDEACDQAW